MEFFQYIWVNLIIVAVIVMMMMMVDDDGGGDDDDNSLLTQILNIILFIPFIFLDRKSVGVSFFNMDDLEMALLHDKVQPTCSLIIELHVALLNAIVRDRLQSKGKKSQSGFRGPTLKDDTVEMKDNDEVNDLS